MKYAKTPFVSIMTCYKKVFHLCSKPNDVLPRRLSHTTTLYQFRTSTALSIRTSWGDLEGSATLCSSTELSCFLWFPEGRWFQTWLFRSCCKLTRIINHLVRFSFRLFTWHSWQYVALQWAVVLEPVDLSCYEVASEGQNECLQEARDRQAA